MVGFDNSDYNARNFSNSDISNSGKLFVALTSCPSFYERLYRKLIYGPEHKIATLASNIVKKAKGDFKENCQNFFSVRI